MQKKKKTSLSVLFKRRAHFYKLLRSKRYHQTKGKLGDFEGGRCCLGVACESARIQGLDILKKKDPAFQYSYDGDTSLLTKKIANFFGFNNTNPILRVRVQKDDDENDTVIRSISAISCNDDWDLPFAVIADGFERKYPCTKSEKRKKELARKPIEATDVLSKTA